MAGRRGMGRASAKKTAVAASAGKNTSKLTKNSSKLLSAAVRQDQRRGCSNSAAAGAKTKEAPEEEVTLLYRTPSTRNTRPQKSCAALPDAPIAAAEPLTGSARRATSDSAVASTTALSAEKSILSFVQRTTGQVNLPRYLSHCGVKDAHLRSADGKVTYAVSQERIFHCSSDRLETATQALINIAALIYTRVDTSALSKTPWGGHVCWVQTSHQQAMVALARVCEAAVPLQLPPLVDTAVLAMINGEKRKTIWTLSVEVVEGRQTMMTSRNTPDASGNEDSKQGKEAGAAGASTSSPHSTSTPTIKMELVPSPVRLCDVRRRLGCLRRLRQLRVAYGTLLPRLHSAGTMAELCRCLFAHDTDVFQMLCRLRHLWMSGGDTATSSAALNDRLWASTLAYTVSGEKSGPAAAKALEDVLSSFLGNPLLLDTLLPLAGISSRHPQEEALLQHFMVLLKDATAIDASTWGPMAAVAMWRCSDGVYVVQHASRVRALRRVLAEAQFYGLPRFLRSIRVPAAAAGLSGGSDDSSWTKPTALLRSQSRSTDQFFLTPDLLDPSSFVQPDSMQAQLVQEELITLQRSHCAFCLVVGEADEIVALVHGHLASAGRVWQHLVHKKEDRSGGAVKTEPPAVDEDEEYGKNIVTGVCTSSFLPNKNEQPQHSSHIDPLHRYVLRTADAARRDELEKKNQPPPTSASAISPPFSHVQWAEGGSTNQWSLNTNYYGLVYMVVLETDEWETGEASLATEGLLPRTAISITEGGGTETLRPPRPPTYCMNAMLELRRS